MNSFCFRLGQRSAFLAILVGALLSTFAVPSHAADVASGAQTILPTATPPPFTDGAGSSAKSIDAVPKIDPIARGVVQVAHNRWAKGVGVGLSPNLSFAGGHPVLMLMTNVNEPATTKHHLEQAVVEACQFLLDDTTFDKAVICVARVNPKNPDATKMENIVVTRDAYQKAIKGAGKSQKLPESFAKLRGDKAGVHQAYAELGFK
jgi:hypothetical protein